ncbi:glycoside hydrolase superfamily [Crucibulum laeve]|uniref:Glycoside hydrolase superfamily n=1 Tax=Crucibulum laeve TaxID=68775 RepID=A0A5C3LXZ2_9AGAR|nr:glycoside hydrolase superfamily [Crucibulum laeve]
MRSIKDKLRRELANLHNTNGGTSNFQQPLSNENINEQEIYRYRKQRGINLGSWFVLERWIADYPYQHAHEPGQSDLDVARGDKAKEILEGHWDNWIVEEDWDWISKRGLNTVRIPIGYYHLCGVDPSVIEKTDFKDFGNVFAGAWSRIVKAIESAHQYGIGVLIDLHAAPGKQNADSHSGTSGDAAFFKSSHHQKHTMHVLRSLVTHLPRLPNIVGIELLNEPHPPSDEILREWYSAAIKDLRSIDPTLPIYIGECWRTDSYTNWMVASRPNPGALIVLDHHLYRCFTSSDIHTSAAEHTASLSLSPPSAFAQQLASISEKLGRAGGGLVIGEWSGALNPRSLRGIPNEKREWVEAQLRLYEAHCAGWFWWTFKKQHGGDSGWGFRDAVATGVFPDWVGVKPGNRVGSAKEEREVCRLTFPPVAAHTNYWNQYPGSYDHARFGDGYVKGWDDAYIFFLSSLAADGQTHTSIPEIGFKGAWALRRTPDHGKTYWEFEHGFFQGMDAAKTDFAANYC